MDASGTLPETPVAPSVDQSPKKQLLAKSKECKDRCIRHPSEFGETYCEHFTYTCLLGGKLVGYGCVAMIHGLCPFCFARYVSRRLAALNTDINTRVKKARAFYKINATQREARERAKSETSPLAQATPRDPEKGIKVD